MLNGKFIGVKERANTFTVEKKFNIESLEKAVLKITALGLYYAEINGVRVGDCYLTPGWTSYNKTLQMQIYNVTELLKEGENVISFTVNEGWYSGGLTWEKKRNLYGEQTAVCAELVCGNSSICTDESWTARESVIRESGIYDGETVDYTKKLKPLTVCEVEFDKAALVAQQCEPVRDIERLAVKEIILTPNGETVYDFGQNIAGVVEIKTPENFDGTLTLRFAEILIHGNFYTDNLRGAKATDTFTVKGAKTLCPEFTFHGFRYLKITGGEIPKENITAIVRHTDMKKTGVLQTSNNRFNRLVSNIVWGQRGNFVDIPTDCPQRDERLGWTGDINAFCGTAAFNYDISAFMKKWLNDLRNDQKESGKISHVAPDVLRGENDSSTSAMWCDAITMVPWNLYQTYGDMSFLKDNYSAMKKFVSAREKNMTDGIIDKGFEWGDWLALDQEKTSYETFIGRTDIYYITNVFHVATLKIVAETARLLGEKSETKLYKDKYEKHLKRVREEYITAGGRLCFDTVTAQVLALHFGIIPEQHCAKVAEMLNENVKVHNYTLCTGFMGTTYLLYALADNGYMATAQKVLMNNGFPGWLYEVDMGATTVWERWNSLMPDGTPNPDGMNSYNHYAYGSVMEFVVKRIAGLQPVEAGYKKVKFAPNPCKGLAEIRAEYDSVSGKIVSGYKQKNGKITFFAEIPDGVEAEIVLPNEQLITVKGGKYEFERKWEDLNAPPFTPESMVNEVFANPVAAKAFNEVFGGIFTGREIAWMRGDKTLQFMAEFRDMEKKMKLSDFPEMLEKANKLFEEDKI